MYSGSPPWEDRSGAWPVVKRSWMWRSQPHVCTKPVPTPKTRGQPPANPERNRQVRRWVGVSSTKRSLHSRAGSSGKPVTGERLRTPDPFESVLSQVRPQTNAKTNGLRTFRSGRCCKVEGMKHSALCFRPVSPGGVECVRCWACRRWRLLVSCDFVEALPNRWVSESCPFGSWIHSRTSRLRRQPGTVFDQHARPGLCRAGPLTPGRLVRSTT